MRSNPRQLYWIAAALAALSAILQLTAREWFRGVTGIVIAFAMSLAALGFPERSETNRRLYFALLGLMSAMLIAQIYMRMSRT